MPALKTYAVRAADCTYEVALHAPVSRPALPGFFVVDSFLFHCYNVRVR